MTSPPVYFTASDGIRSTTFDDAPHSRSVPLTHDKRSITPPLGCEVQDMLDGAEQIEAALLNIPQEDG